MSNKEVHSVLLMTRVTLDKFMQLWPEATAWKKSVKRRQTQQEANVQYLPA